MRTYPGQWIQCDVRHLDLSVLGKFRYAHRRAVPASGLWPLAAQVQTTGRTGCSVIMADPPWQIRMDLPYGTMSDNEMRQLQLGELQV